jgi:hypothetical protein
MPAALGGTFSPRRIIDPYASHYFAVPNDWFDFLVWRSCLRVFCAGLLSALASTLSLVAMWRLPSDPPLSTHLIVLLPTDGGKRPQPLPVPGCCTWRSPDHCEQAPALASHTLQVWRAGLPLHDRVSSPPSTSFHGVHVPSSGERHLWPRVRCGAKAAPGREVASWCPRAGRNGRHDRVLARARYFSVSSPGRSDGRRSTTLLPGALDTCVRRSGLEAKGPPPRCSLRSE